MIMRHAETSAAPVAPIPPEGRAPAVSLESEEARRQKLSRSLVGELEIIFSDEKKFFDNKKKKFDASKNLSNQDFSADDIADFVQTVGYKIARGEPIPVAVIEHAVPKRLRSLVIAAIGKENIQERDLSTLH